jgi:hypothetical protein
MANLLKRNTNNNKNFENYIFISQLTFHCINFALKFYKDNRENTQGAFLKVL